MKELNGSITIYFTFAIVLIISVVMSVTEMARINCQKMYLQIATDASIDSMASLFHRNLYRYYNLYGVEYKTYDMLRAEYMSYMDPFLIDGDGFINNWYIGKIDENDVDLRFKLLLDEDCFEKEIVSYMKYNLLGKAISYLGRNIEIKDEDSFNELENSAKEIFEEVEKGDIYEEIYERYFDFKEDIKLLEKQGKIINDYVRLVNRQVASIQSASVSGTLTNAVYMHNKFETLEKDVNIFNEALLRYREHMVEFRQKVLESKDNYLRDRALGIYNFTDEVIEFIETEFDKFLSFVDEESPMNKAIEKGFEKSSIIKENVTPDKEEILELANRLQSIELELAEERRKSARERDREYIRELTEEKREVELSIKEFLMEVKIEYENYTIDNIELDISREDHDSDEKLLDKLVDLKNGLLINMILDEDDIEKISNVTQSIKDYNVLSRNDNISINKVLLGEYELDKFNYYNKELNNEITKSGSNRLEVERLICGKNKDIENIKEIIDKIMLIRIALNVLYIYTHADKREAVRSWTLATFGGFSMLLAEAMFLLVLTAWGTAQALADVREILNGKRVSLIHTDESWTVSIGNILDIARDGITGSSDEDDNGVALNYKDYLRLLLLSTRQGDINDRMVGLIEYNIKEQQASFDFEKLIYSFETENSYICEHFFTNFTFVDAKNIALSNKYKIKTNAYRGFYE